jgi:CDP-diacylglycerol--serine O-phosphatidyltransferase
MFGVKDLFTTINLMGGVVGVCLCIDGQPYYAGVAVLLGYLLGDTMDGWVARKLGTANQFGAEFDTISDHMSHVIAPSARVYTVYKDQHLLPEPWMNRVAMLLTALSLRRVRRARIVAPVGQGRVGRPTALRTRVLAIAYCSACSRPTCRAAAGSACS